ncbi:hypothetical protein [Sphingomonas hengshuiensis]|uniref:DNA transposition protein n=1 Tax=Sphingomonas hengshuiensis TaxID=1609977 RepID=A0A7U4JAG6_9SPHN|nr:hypothetical protein [Sphingomonas hengshuiensis]AJP73147.1 hypothetical protein TS85_17130 [Sphingomonas hengshuiensis]
MSRRAAPDPRQIDLFAAERPVGRPGGFAGADAWVATEVAQMLKDDPRSREEIAGALSASLCEEVSRWMLDAYASPGRDSHNISFARAIALAAVTGSRALIEEAVARLGGEISWGSQIVAAELGRAEAEAERLKIKIKTLRHMVRRDGHR